MMMDNVGKNRKIQNSRSIRFLRHSADNFDDWESQTIIVNTISGTQSWSAACNDTGIPQVNILILHKLFVSILS